MVSFLQLPNWKKGPDFDVVGPDANDCAVASRNRVFASRPGSSKIYTTHLKHGGFQNWEPLKESLDFIKCLFSDSSGSRLYVCASGGKGKDQIFEFHPESEVSIDVFRKLTDVPNLLDHRRHTNWLFKNFSLTASHDRIYMVQWNGWDPTAASAYDLTRECWLEKINLPFSCCDCSCVCIRDTLYALGSGIKPISSDSTSSRNLVALPSNEAIWQTYLPPVPQNYAKLTVDRGDHLLAIGGREVEAASTSATILDWPELMWLKLPSTLSGHYRHGVCVTDENDLVAVGGYGNITTEVLSVPEALVSGTRGSSSCSIP